jgi:hypothetical protein
LGLLQRNPGLGGYLHEAATAVEQPRHLRSRKASVSHSHEGLNRSQTSNLQVSVRRQSHHRSDVCRRFISTADGHLLTTFIAFADGHLLTTFISFADGHLLTNFRRPLPNSHLLRLLHLLIPRRRWILI